MVYIFVTSQEISPNLDLLYPLRTGLKVGHYQWKTWKYHCWKARNSQTTLFENLLWQNQIIQMNKLWDISNICHGWSQELQITYRHCYHSQTRLTSGREDQKVPRLECFSLLMLHVLKNFNVTIIKLNKSIVTKVILSKTKCYNIFVIKISTHVFLLITYCKDSFDYVS